MIVRILAKPLSLVKMGKDSNPKTIKWLGIVAAVTAIISMTAEAA
jgi:hypothetical protein